MRAPTRSQIALFNKRVRDFMRSPVTTVAAGTRLAEAVAA